MQLSSLFAGLLALAPLFVAGSPVPNDVTVPEHEASLFAKRDSCYTGSTYNSADANKMANNLQTINPDKLHYLGHGQSTSWTVGTARVCIYNKYIFENTHVKEWEVGWAMKAIASSCNCNNNAQW